MSKLKDLFASKKARIIALAVLCALLIGVAVCAGVFSRVPAETVSYIASSSMESSSVSSSRSKPASSSKADSSQPVSSSAAAADHYSGEEDEPPESIGMALDEVLEEVAQNADARFDEAEKERAMLARRNEIGLELANLDDAILSLESEKTAACELRDLA